MMRGSGSSASPGQITEGEVTAGEDKGAARSRAIPPDQVTTTLGARFLDEKLDGRRALDRGRGEEGGRPAGRFGP